MKYIATTVTGYALMTRDIEIEIDNAKLEAALADAMQHQSEEDWDGWGKPADELWVTLDELADVCYVNEDTIEDMARDIVDEWEELPDCDKVRDCDLNKMLIDFEESEPHKEACRQWLHAKGWAQRPNDYGIEVWYHKK